jgi:Na+-transporting NADH:ubiquinone oxidoreductase subunit C
VNKKSPVYVLSFMAVICLVFGASIAVVNYATLGLLAKNATLHKNSVLCRAFQIDVPGKATEDYQKAVDENLVESKIGSGAEERTLFKRITPGKESVGFLMGGMGFWDRIEAVVVLTPDLKEILNVQFMDQKETPGLGARIEEPWFTDQFKGLTVAWEAAKDERIVVGASSDPNAKNRVDGITGATQTSMALMHFLNEELDSIRPLIAASTLNPEP